MAREPIWIPLLSLPSPCVFPFHPWIACLFPTSSRARPSSPALLPPALVFWALHLSPTMAAGPRDFLIYLKLIK